MDEKQKYIEAWEEILKGLYPELPEEERKRRVLESATRKFDSNKSQETETHA